MKALTFTRGTNGKGNLFWVAEDLSGLIIERKPSDFGRGFVYSVKQYAQNGAREIASFDTKQEAVAFVKAAN